MPLEIIILAAGQGTRMRSALPKVLHKVGSKSLLEHVHALAASLSPDQISIIYGHGGEQVPRTLARLDAVWAEQKQQLGTGHAVMQVADGIGDDATVLILYGDVPLLKKTTVEKLLPLVGPDSLGLLTVELDDPHGYGRIVRDETGRVLRIVEEKDANPQERAITEGNTGILALNGRRLKSWLGRLGTDNAQGEYYLTDVIALAVAEGCTVATAQPASMDEVLGVNNRQQLAHLERVFQAEQAEALLLAGATLRDPARFDLRGEIVALGRDVEIDVNVILEGRVKLGDRVKIGPNTLIRDCEIGDDVEIFANCVLEDAVVGRASRIGPYARLRPETRLAEEVHIGNFVEIKKSTIAQGSKANHLSYIGDTDMGAGVNIGAGTITCNYDGVNKHRTIIEDGVFVGSDSSLVAPVRIGKDATIGAGSVITKEAPQGQLTLTRAKQVTIAGWQRPTKARS
ncbi:bifunctional UDP-N-acetylglucosamine pyrophosphorylase / Glucosamine-1-phosphate N-acetyltransferase [Methylomagnum ishizawai]|uniref:Bifunctional protein GlmU n=1 Tax=Methylomagnum ishizawai TaxID=1760988 RepID=A0A1Y6CRN6_9GAMM|nr:bifunctional UDP-N-acetylglucosamine diphosphorylase/glucosamine-1-phosphate N-acetyltransferase GlmU [Methylomagnum ishizawai]SMF93289.1 bifunctional UDP-N-acetylglucosamine pyrophosphorylase / Glucosamine-1-phosphate N-acetyltransferase [Methylomagnum ishizawai]